MMVRIVALLLMLFAWPAAAAAQQPVQAWIESERELAFGPADVAFSRQAGSISVTETGEFSRQGENLDNFVQYRSADGVVIGTVYIYYPGLAHSGIAAIATDFAIRANSTSPVRALGSSVVGAGGEEGVAIRNDYANYRNGHASTAAFIKLDRWQLKLRVSGPEERRAEVEAAMAALLDGIRFGPTNRVRPAAPVALGRCEAGAGAVPANLLPDPSPEEVAAHAILGTLDGGGLRSIDEATGQLRDLPSRVPDSFCLSTPEGRLRPIVRAAEGPALSIDGRTLLFAIVSDSGTWLEVVHAPRLGGYVLLYHQIGSTSLLGRFDAIPSDAQIDEMFTTPRHPAGRVRAVIELRPGQGDNIHLAPPVPDERPARPAAIT